MYVLTVQQVFHPWSLHDVKEDIVCLTGFSNQSHVGPGCVTIDGSSHAHSADDNPLECFKKNVVCCRGDVFGHAQYGAIRRAPGAASIQCALSRNKLKRAHLTSKFSCVIGSRTDRCCVPR